MVGIKIFLLINRLFCSHTQEFLFYPERFLKNLHKLFYSFLIKNQTLLTNNSLFGVFNTEVLNMEWIFKLTNYLIGTCLASHAALICDRWDDGNFIFTRSRCSFCHTELCLLDELPIFSYFWLHGKCRYCHNFIPPKLVVIEIIGGFAFISFDFSKLLDILTAIFVFSLLLAAICDYDQMEFYLIMILPAVILALWQSPKIFSYQLFDFIQLIPVLIILIYYNLTKKLGFGDFLIYLTLALYFNPEFANHVFLFGALFSLTHFWLDETLRSTTSATAFVPDIFLGLIVQLLLR
ncbi:prepilin peptidase [Lactobacillus sp. ESL0228]|nr:prepilin peptidase [Lactobacillus sp. ESL0228]